MKTSCSFLFFFEKHDWGRWVSKEVVMNRITYGFDRKVTASVPYGRIVQERTCKNCHKIQQEIICD